MSHKRLTQEELNIKMADFIAGHMSEEETNAFNQLISDNPQYKQKLDKYRQMMEIVGQHEDLVIPEPSSQMDDDFYSMLDAEVKRTQINQDTNQTSSLWSKLKNWVQLPQVRKLSYGLSFMAVGVFVGHYLHLFSAQTEVEVQRLAIKDQQIQALTVLSLLDMPSANKRLMAINLASMSNQSNQPNQAILDALLVTLKQDNNVNVRLEALDVLAKLTSNESVRTGLVSSINQQQSPMVQIALANLMLQMKEQDAIEPMQELLQQTDLIEPVREQLNQTINELVI